MKYFLFLFIFFSIFLCETVFGRGRADNNVKITGMVQVYGSEPHTFVGIAGENGVEYAVYPKAMENELMSLQGYLIEFTVIFVEEESYGSFYLRGGTVTPVRWKVIR